MAEIHAFPKQALPPRLMASPVAALAASLSDLYEIDPFTCVAGAMIVQDKLKGMGFEVVRVLDITMGGHDPRPVV